jgi:enediyne biosynthesis protein CalE5
VSIDQIKAQQLKHWNHVAAGWAAWLQWTEQNFRPLTAWLQTAVWQPGTRVLDVACGPGYPALAASAAVRPAGAVLATDISAAMITEASRFAEQRRADNIQFAEMDAEHLLFDSGAFDSVTNAYGLMFCSDPQRAIAEAYRVLKPGGRLAVVAWDEPARNPFFATIGGIARSVLSLPPIDLSAPGPFRFAAAGELERVMRAGGFTDLSIESLPMTFECSSVAEYIQIFSDFALKKRISGLSPADLDGFVAAVEQAAQPHMSGGRLRLLTTSRCALGTKLK